MNDNGSSGIIVSFEILFKGRVAMESHSKIHKMLTNLNKIKWSIVLKGLIVGVVSGLLAILYRLCLEYGIDFATKIYAFMKIHPLAVLLWIIAAVAAGFFIAYLVKLEPMASGSGIPQVEGVVLFGLKMKWYTILAVRFLGGALCSVFGLSLGREGPSIQIGACGGQFVSKRCGKDKLEENYLITGGAAAGLSAAFNAPLSGMVFALEEVHRSFSPLILLSATVASLTADFISKTVFGLRPVLDFQSIPELPLKFYLWLIPLGVVAGLTGSLMNKSLLLFQSLYNRLPARIRPMTALLIALPFGLFLPQVLGGGQGLIKMSESAQVGIAMLLIFFLAKMLFTCTSFGSGVPGGIFLPILSIGALSGGIFGLFAAHFGLPSQYIADFAVCAMAGALSSAVKAPVTSILLTAEMSGTLVHMLPVAICSFIALLLSDVLKVQPIYEALLERFVEKQGDTLAVEEKGGLYEIPVELGSFAAGKQVSDIDWPSGTLIVGIRRGTKEIVPKGDTLILQGDYLVILSEQKKEEDIKNKIESLCRSK